MPCLRSPIGLLCDPVNVETAGDRGFYSAPALSPDGTDLYLVYNAFATPFRDDTTSTRGLIGVVLHANVSGTSLSGWTELPRGDVGDPQASSANALISESLGDYVYAAASRTYGSAVWNDVRNGVVCTAINTYRQALQDEDENATAPAPQQDCPAGFGDTDIFGGSYADPS